VDGLDVRGLPPFSFETVLSPFDAALFGFKFRAVETVLEIGLDVRADLLTELLVGLSAGLGESVLELEIPADSVRGVFERGALRSSLSAFLLGTVEMGRGAGVDDGPASSPVIDASRSEILSKISIKALHETSAKKLTGIVNMKMKCER